MGLPESFRDNWRYFVSAAMLFAFAGLFLYKSFFPEVSPLIIIAEGLVIVGLALIANALIHTHPGPAPTAALHNPAPQDDLSLYLKDWEMTKDRIKHFDDTVVRIRLQGIPIATAILAAGFLAYKDLKAIPITIYSFQIPAFSMLFLASFLFVIPIALLDWLHYSLLLKAVTHGVEIENMPEFTGRLRITNVLTSRTLTAAHSFAAFVLYVSIAAIALFLFLTLR